jgi:hypothetical protein
MNFPGRLDLAILESVNPEIAENSDFYEELDELLDGGPKMLRHRSEYLVKKPEESSEEYQYRLKLFSYDPVLARCLAQLSNKFMSAPWTVEFPKDAREDAFWESFRENTNLANRNERNFIKDSFDFLLKYRRVWGIIESTGAKEGGEPYILIAGPDTVVHWDKDKFGNLLWIKRRVITTEFNPVGGSKDVATWTFYTPQEIAIYESRVKVDSDGLKVLKENGDIAEEQEVPLLDVVSHERPTTPVVEICIEKHLWVTYLALPLVLEHIRVHNNINYVSGVAGTIQRTFTPMKMDANSDWDTEEATKKFGNSSVVIGEKFAYAESAGTALPALAARLKEIETAIKDLVFASPISAAQNQPSQESGVAKGMDFYNQEEALRGYGDSVIRFLEMCYQKVAEAMKFKAPEKISANGMLQFNMDSLDDKIARLTQLETLNIPVSPECWKLVAKDLARALVPQASSKQIKTIELEIDAEFAKRDKQLLGFAEAAELFGAQALDLETFLNILGLDAQKIMPKLEEQRKKVAQEAQQQLEDMKLFDTLTGVTQGKPGVAGGK